LAFQLIINIVVNAASICLVAISFSLIYSVSKFFHFAHAAVITFSAYTGFAIFNWLSFPLYISIPISIALAGLLGWLMNKAIYSPMRSKGTTPLILLLTSLGLYIVIQNIVSFVFGDDTKILRHMDIESSLDFIGANITVIQLTTICIAIIIMIALSIFVGKTKYGLRLRAVACDEDLARISGISIQKIHGMAFFWGSCLAGLSGLFAALDTGMTPTMGLPMLLMGVVVTIVGGAGSIRGIALASLLLAVCQQITAWKWGSQWQEMVAFLILIVFLLAKPEGLQGNKIRKASI